MKKPTRFRKRIRYESIFNRLSREDRFKATVAAMNTLLAQKGIYTQEEFEEYFCQWGEAAIKKANRP